MEIKNPKGKAKIIEKIKLNQVLFFIALILFKRNKQTQKEFINVAEFFYKMLRIFYKNSYNTNTQIYSVR